MGLGNFFKKKEPKLKNENSHVLLSMPMFNEGDAYSLDDIINDLKTYWQLQVTEITGDDNTAAFKINDQLVAIGKMPAPIPYDDIETTAGFTYLWKNVLEECKMHRSHAIVSVLSGDGTDVERHKLLTKLNASILRTSNAIGIYQGMQTLLLPKGLYLEFADFLLTDELPVQLWVYIGLVTHQGKNNVYTYGLQTFNKSEVEIIDSEMTREELYDFIVPILSYIIGYDVTLKHGETIGFTAEQKISITEGKAKFTDGKALRLAV